jgi:hypothetical protein
VSLSNELLTRCTAYGVAFWTDLEFYGFVAHLVAYPLAAWYVMREDSTTSVTKPMHERIEPALQLTGMTVVAAAVRVAAGLCDDATLSRARR